jgi:hypothetical protein
MIVVVELVYGREVSVLLAVPEWHVWIGESVEDLLSWKIDNKLSTIVST